LISRWLFALVATISFALVGKAQPPSTAPYIQYAPAQAGYTGGADPYATTTAPYGPGWFGTNGIVMPVMNQVQDRAWWRVEYLIWWTEGMDLPPLVTTSPLGTPQNEAGRLGFADTTVRFGNQDINTGSTGGLRGRSGYWFTDDHRFGIESEFFRLRNQHDGFSAAGDGDPILARPYFNIVTGDEDAQLISYPGFAAGDVRIKSKNKLESYMFSGRFATVPAPNWQTNPGEQTSRADWIIGYRRLKLEDNVHISDNVTLTGPPVTDIATVEHFATKNKFDGVQLGFVYQRDFQRARLESRMRVALGNNKQTVNIGGTNTITVGGLTTVTDGGLLAQATNSGNFTRNEFTMIPELGATLGIRITDRIHGTVGYTVLYYPNVVRAGDQIDTDVNPTLIGGGPLVGAPRPRFRFIDNDFWAHGLNLGAEVRF
jgi:hypothetical protein